MRKLLVILLTAAIFLSLQIAVAGEAVATFKIGVLEPLTGQHSAGGKAELDGIRFAMLGRPTLRIAGTTVPVELVVEDNASSPAQSSAAAYRLIDTGVNAVIGSYGSSVTLAAAPAFDAHGIPAIAASATNPKVTDSSEMYFRLCLVDTFQGPLMAQYAWDQGYRSIALVTELDDDFSQDVGAYFAAAFEKLGGQILSRDTFELVVPQDKDLSTLSVQELADAMTVDFGPLAASLAAARPDAVYIPSSLKAAPLFLQALQAAGAVIPVLSADTWDNSLIPLEAGAAAEGVTFSTFLDLSQNWVPQTEDFRLGFALYQDSVYPGREGLPSVTALGFDAYHTILNAVEAANSTDPQDIRSALTTLQFEGASGPVAFDENGNNKVEVASIMQIKDGKITFVKRAP